MLNYSKQSNIVIGNKSNKWNMESKDEMFI